MNKLIEETKGKKIEITQDELIFLVLAVSAKLSCLGKISHRDIETSIKILGTTLRAINENPTEATRREIEHSQKAYQLCEDDPDEVKKQIVEALAELFEKALR